MHTQKMISQYQLKIPERRGDGLNFNENLDKTTEAELICYPPLNFTPDAQSHDETIIKSFLVLFDLLNIWSDISEKVCCSVLQCVAVCCSALQCVAIEHMVRYL